MKKFKSFLSGFIAAATVITSVGFTASAYDVCDLNKDGKVDTRDVSIISRYLSAKVVGSSYNLYDVNKSLTVDYMDEQYVLAKVMGYSYDCKYFSRATKKYSTALTVSGSNLDYTANSTESRTYMVYSYTNKKQMSNYTLYPSDTPIFSSNSSSGVERSIIGSDDRYLASGPENTGIVHLVKEGDIGGGSGFIVDDHHIATAAHCVYDAQAKYWKDISFINTYNADGTISNKKLTPVEAHVPQIYNTNSERRYDYALITVKEDLSDYVHFDLGTSYNVNISNFSDIPIYVTGCPQSTPTSSTNPTNRLYSAEGRVSNNTNTSVLNYNADTEGGNSGGPVYTVTRNVVNNKPSYSYTALAVHHGGYNSGSLITKYHLQFYKNNPYANY